MHMTTFDCQTYNAFLDLYDDIAKRVSDAGVAVIDTWDTEAATLKLVAERFGSVQTHILADANGLVGIATDTIVNRDWESYRSEYAGLSTEEFLPHTDGSYLHGLVHREDARYIELLPPKMLILQCWQCAETGGANILIDGQRVYEALGRESRSQLTKLSTKGCVTYCRDDQIAVDRAVFEELDDGSIMLRFRYDSTAYVADWSLDAFHDLQKHYFANPKYQSRLMLRAGQIIVIDNSRMLHGRDSFANGVAGQDRKLRRVWLAHDRLPVRCNAADEHRERRAMKPFQAYDILPRSALSAESLPESMGIRKFGQGQSLSVRRVSLA
jgi:alpha-ketoglutarate-dependent taurine dioxygenase